MSAPAFQPHAVAFLLALVGTEETPVKVAALRMLEAVLSAAPSSHDVQVVVPPLLAALTFADAAVRQCALRTLMLVRRLPQTPSAPASAGSNVATPARKAGGASAGARPVAGKGKGPAAPAMSLARIYGGYATLWPLEQEPWLGGEELAWLLTAVLNAAQEIAGDATYLSALLSAALSPALAATDGAATTAEHVLRFLAAAVACHPNVSVQMALAAALDGVTHPVKLEALTCTLLRHILAVRADALPAQRAHQLDLIHLVLRAYSGSALSEDDAAWVVFQVALDTEVLPVPEGSLSPRQAALAVIKPAFFRQLTPALQATLFERLCALLSRSAVPATRAALAAVLRRLPLTAALFESQVWATLSVGATPAPSAAVAVPSQAARGRANVATTPRSTAPLGASKAAAIPATSASAECVIRPNSFRARVNLPH